MEQITLLVDLPIEAKHGATAGRVFGAERVAGGWSFVGDAMECCHALDSEVYVNFCDDFGDDCPF